MVEIAQTADHALRILEELGRGEPLSPSQLSQRLDLNRTVIHRLLATLNARGFVLRQGALYRTGATLIRLAKTLEPNLRAAALPVMKRLTERVGESAVLHVVDGLEAVVLDQTVASKHVVQVSHEIGSRHPLTQGASGRAILAFLPPAAVERALRGNDQAASIKRKLDVVRQLRYALSHDELQIGVHGVAVPVLDQDGSPLASLALLAPQTRAQGLEDHVDELWVASDEISMELHPHSATEDSA